MGLFGWLFRTKSSSDQRTDGDAVTQIIPERYPDGCRQKPLGLDSEITKILGTDTACFVVYDLAALKHRLTDTCDWWSIPEDEIIELKNRNLLILGVGADGGYDVSVHEGTLAGAPKYSLRFPSGEIFVGPGEVVSGEDMEPDGEYGSGFFLSVEPGDYVVSAVMDETRVKIAICKAGAFSNEISEPVTLFGQ